MDVDSYFNLKYDYWSQNYSNSSEILYSDLIDENAKFVINYVQIIRYYFNRIWQTIKKSERNFLFNLIQLNRNCIRLWWSMTDHTYVRLPFKFFRSAIAFLQEK